MFLLVTPAGGKLWRLKYRIGGREKLLAMGAYPEIGLGEARRRREEARELIALGKDPSREKQREKVRSRLQAADTFNAICKEYCDKRRRDGSKGWAPATAIRSEYLLSLVCGSIGKLPIGEIEPADVLTAIRRIEGKGKLDNETAIRTGKPLSRATVNSTLSALRAFFVWLAGQPGYKSHLHYADADYFNLAETEVRIAKAVRHKAFPTLEQVHHVLSAMPSGTDIEKRNRALVAFALLTGARDGALAIVQDWCGHLRESMLWGDDDPLFPATRIGLGDGGGFTAVGLRRDGWHSAGPVRDIFRAAFEAAGLPYFNPHSFRDTLVQLGEKICPTIEAFKAWSQNLGHERVMTTLTSYGAVAAHRQAELIRGMGKRDNAPAALTRDQVLGLRALLAQAGDHRSLS